MELSSQRMKPPQGLFDSVLVGGLADLKLMVRVFRPGVLFEVKEKGELIVASGILSFRPDISWK